MKKKVANTATQQFIIVYWLCKWFQQRLNDIITIYHKMTTDNSPHSAKLKFTIYTTDLLMS